MQDILNATTKLPLKMGFIAGVGQTNVFLVFKDKFYTIKMQL